MVFLKKREEVIERLKSLRIRNALVCGTFVIVTICVLSMSDEEFKETVEDVTELEEKITVEIDNIGKLLEDLDFLKEKLRTLHKKIEEINNRGIDSLEAVLNQKVEVLESKIKERLWVLKEDEKELQEMSKDIEIWKSQDLNNGMDSLYKSLYKVYKDSLYIKLPMLRTGVDSICFPSDSFANMENGSDSILIQVDTSISTHK